MEVLERRYGDDPRFVIGMLVQMSGRYMDLGDTNGEYGALVKAEGLARKLGDPERIAFVQCNTVETELALGKPAQARERMNDGLAQLAKLGTPSYERATDCGLAQARLLWAEGNLPAGIDTAMKVAAMIEGAGKTDTDLTYQSTTSMLEVMLGLEGRHREALEWNTRSLSSLERSGRDTTISMNHAHHNRARHLYDLGEMRAALDEERSVVRQLLAQQGEDAVQAPHAARLGLYEVQIEEADAGLKWLDRAVSVAASLHNRLDQIGALMNRGQAYVLLGRLDAAAADFAGVEQLAAENPRENGDQMRAVRLGRAQIDLARHQPEAALRELDTILAEVGYPADRVSNRLATVLTTKARAQLALSRNADALATARAAVDISEASALEPDQSAYTGAALMTLAEAQRATGDAAAARASASRAASVLSASFGPNHSATRAALQFQ
jgi:tetratricopeptide (TPR) repeat protein